MWWLFFWRIKFPLEASGKTIRMEERKGHHPEQISLLANPQSVLQFRQKQFRKQVLRPRSPVDGSRTTGIELITDYRESFEKPISLFGNLIKSCQIILGSVFILNDSQANVHSSVIFNSTRISPFLRGNVDN